MDNRLQFRHHGIGSGYTVADGVFETRDEAIEYIYSQIRFAESGLAFEDKTYGYSLFGEPTILRYKNSDDETNPHVILAIGSVTNDGQFGYGDNRFCIIDTHKTESEIEELWEEIEKAVKGLTLITRDTNTLKLYSEKTEDGTVLSGDVKVARAQIFDDIRKPNIILSTDDGLFTYVNMDYDKDDDKLTFTVNGDSKEWFINNNYLVRGYYSKRDESIHLIRKDNVDITVSLENLIDEWGTEGEASNTPIVLIREEIGYGDNSAHNHVEPWQDVLKGDVRLADRKYNILKKTSDGRYLYVDGLANNITYFRNGEEVSVADVLNEVGNGASNDSTNIIYEKPDGFYANASLRYINRENKLVFTTSNVTGGTTVEEIQLNAVDVFKKVYYDPVTENLVIMYVDGNGELQEVDIPIGEMMTDWEWDIVNEGHNVKLHKQRVINGNDKVSADVALYDVDDNILVDKNHELYVKGTADNIKFGNSTVKEELEKLGNNDIILTQKVNETSGKVDTLKTDFDREVTRSIAEDERLNEKIDAEESRSKEKDLEHDTKITTIKQTIGDGFTTDGHGTITYKFNELSAKTDTTASRVDTIYANVGLISAKTDAEIVRAKGEEERIEKKFDDEIGDGFNIRNTVRDEIDREKGLRENKDDDLQRQIDAITGGGGKVREVINKDHSIDVDNSESGKSIVSVNISDELIDGKRNVIKLNNDGLYAGVDLEYVFDEDTGANTLFFSTTNGTKRIELKTNSVVDKIYYDPSLEAIIIEYTVNGKRMPDVVVPVGDLINEWRVSDSTNGAIKLSLQREASGTTKKDVLYAETVIATHEDNILINDDGALYVPGAQIEKNKADIAALGERMDTAEADIDALEDGLANEIIRAQGEESRIEGKLDREVERSVAEDDAIWQALRDEILRSTNKDNEHDTRISNEITDRTNADLELERLIHAEEDRAKNAESAITHNLNIEIAARQSGDTLLNQKIDTEVANREAGDANLQTQITNEVNRATSEEQRIEGKLDQEISRSTTKDDDLQQQINAEVIRATSAESVIREALTREISDRTVGDANLQAQITSEVERAQGAENALDIKIENEKETRANEDAKIWAKIRPIEFFDTTTVHNERVRNSGETPDEVRHSVILSQASDNILEASDNLGGLYATAKLGYNQSANLLTIYGPNDKILNSVTLGPGSLIKDISYDHTEKDLVVTYRRAGDEEDTIMKFPVADLFNEWDIQNPSEGSALELHKENQTTETGTVDILWGRVLLTGAVERPDGTIDYGDNIIRIVNNGLYASGTPIIEAKRTADCAKNELSVVEEAVLGKHLNELYSCGSGYTYSPFEEACFISNARNMMEADEILDRTLCTVKRSLDCLWEEVNITQQNVIGLIVPDCGKNADGTAYVYPPHLDACFISAATSMVDADFILDQAICNLGGEVDCAQIEVKRVENVLGVSGNCAELINYPVTQGCLLSNVKTFAEADAVLEEAICNFKIDIDGSETPTATLSAITEDDKNYLLEAHVRLSHGNEVGKWQSDEDITISNYNGDEVEPGVHEFTDTNVLRKVDIPSEIPQSKYNGLYLSNVWDCGQYTENGQGTPYEKYKTDESESAQNHYQRRYRNSVRYQNG